METMMASEARNTTHLLRDVLVLFKWRIGVIIALTALVAYVLTPGATATPWQVLVLGFGTLVASASAGAFNHWYEYRSDALMKRTRDRPFVTGALRRHAGWLVLIGGMLVAAVAAVAWWVGLLSALFVFLGAFTYAIVYTVWLKRRTWWNIVVGGLSGSFAALAGSALAEGAPGGMAISLALILFLWTPPHFWSLAIAGREDYRAAGIPMLPVVVGDLRAAHVILKSTVLLVAASFLPLGYGAGAWYAVGAVLGGIWFLRQAWRLTRLPDRRRAILCFLASLGHLCLLFAGACLDVLIG